MGKGIRDLASAYVGRTIHLITKHQKSSVIAPPFEAKLGAIIKEYEVDTDLLGTFSGEVARTGTALDCARRKCEWIFAEEGKKVQFALASEGSFGPHPTLPFIAGDTEILYFIDKEKEFHLYLSYTSPETNYRMQKIDSIDELIAFANQVQFPSHALIMRPYLEDKKETLFKGINTYEDLNQAFEICLKKSPENQVWVETDMRAHLNPMRQAVIGRLAQQMAGRLAKHCPSCDIPGWGKQREERGLACQACGFETELVKHEIWGCVKCEHEASMPRQDNLAFAQPQFCPYCNP